MSLRQTAGMAWDLFGEMGVESYSKCYRLRLGLVILRPGSY